MPQLAIAYFLISHILFFGTVDRIQKAIEKREYEKAEELILKGLEKEPLNPGISYYQAVLLFDESYQYYDLDSARVTIRLALSKYDQANDELLEELAEDNITAERLQKLLEQVRDRSFTLTLENLSIASAKKYQANFPKSVYDDILLYKIDSIEFDIAKAKNSQEALTSFIDRNPTSVFKVTADSILDYMRYDELRQNGNLKSYQRFLSTYPFTQYREPIERYLLKVSTASGQEKKLDDFIAMSKVPKLKKRAADVKYYINETSSTDYHPLTDSIEVAIKVNEQKLFPIVERGLVGFANSEGIIRIYPEYANAFAPYKCMLTNDHWVFLPHDSSMGEIVTKKGEKLLSKVLDYKSLSKGIALVKKNSGWTLYHKSGFPIMEEEIEDAEVLSNSWIKFKQNGKWGLITSLGLVIAEGKYDDIYQKGDFWVFEKDKLIAVYNKELILAEVEDRGLSLEFKFDDIEFVNDNTIIGFRGNRESMLNSKLEFLIPWGNYEIYPERGYWYIKSRQGYRLYDSERKSISNEYYNYLESSDGWLATKTSSGWNLWSKKIADPVLTDYDSIKVVNDYACVLIEDEKSELLFTNSTRVPFERAKISTFPLRSDFLKIQYDNGAVNLYNGQGTIVLAGNYEEIAFLNDTLIKVQVDDKQGLFNTKNEAILDPIFESLDEQDGLILTLRGGKIGSYDLSNSVLLSSQYEARISRLGNNYVAKKDGHLGLIDGNEEEVLSFNYEEIQHWNDTSFLLKKGSFYQIVNSSEEPIYPEIADLKKILQNENESIYRFVKDGKYGLLSNIRGEILEPEFSDISNIGNDDDPLFFADQHLSRAGFHVVSYLNSNGDLVLSRAYTKEEFEKILCDD